MGRAGPTVCAAFDDCTVVVGQGTTTLRARLPDQAALWGLIQRIIGPGLDVVDLHMMRPNRLTTPRQTRRPYGAVAPLARCHRSTSGPTAPSFANQGEQLRSPYTAVHCRSWHPRRARRPADSGNEEGRSPPGTRWQAF